MFFWKCAVASPVCSLQRCRCGGKTRGQQTTRYLYPWAWKHSDKTNIVCALSDTCCIHWWVKGQIYDDPFIGVFADTRCNFPPDKPHCLCTARLPRGSRLAVYTGRHFCPTFFSPKYHCRARRCPFCTQGKMRLNR